MSAKLIRNGVRIYTCLCYKHLLGTIFFQLYSGARLLKVKQFWLENANDHYSHKSSLRKIKCQGITLEVY